MKIIHLSDTHIGKQNNLERFQCVINDILTLENPQDYLIIHTGDLIDQGTEQERALVKPLLEQLTRAGWQLRLCPGNHDEGNSMQVAPLLAQQFRQEFSTYIFGSPAPSSPHFPVVTTIEGSVFIGLDSNQAEMGWFSRWLAEGNLGSEQINALSLLLDSAKAQQQKIIVYLHHHPFFDAYVVAPDVEDGHYLKHIFNWNTRRFRRLKDAYSLMQCLRDRVDILLFGHQHFGLDYSSESQRYGIPLALDASSSTCTQMDTDRMRYRIINTQTGLFVTRFVTLPTSNANG